MDDVRHMAAKIFRDAADAAYAGAAVNSVRAGIAVTGIGSELGEKTITQACAAAASKGYKIYYLGRENVPGAVNISCTDESGCSAEMDRLLSSGQCGAAVTMHHSFPIGTATVGRAVTPSRGKEMFIATTTGTPSADRVESLVLGAIYGIITAKSCGNGNPSVGILNIDGARRAETVLRKLGNGGFQIKLAESARPDGGAIMRGNDVLLGTADVLACDPLTGNMITKMLSAYQSGGDRECVGYGYGPGISETVKKPVFIVSRASGTPVVLNAIRFAQEAYLGGITKIAAGTMALAGKCGLHSILSSQKQAPSLRGGGEVVPPEREPVTEEITGIEVTEIDEAARLLWENGVYAESGMGCTGPVIMVSGKNHHAAIGLLRSARFIEGP